MSDCRSCIISWQVLVMLGMYVLVLVTMLVAVIAPLPEDSPGKTLESFVGIEYVARYVAKDENYKAILKSWKVLPVRIVLLEKVFIHTFRLTESGGVLHVDVNVCFTTFMFLNKGLEDWTRIHEPIYYENEEKKNPSKGGITVTTYFEVNDNILTYKMLGSYLYKFVVSAEFSTEQVIVNLELTIFFDKEGNRINKEIQSTLILPRKEKDKC